MSGYLIKSVAPALLAMTVVRELPSELHQLQLWSNRHGL